MSATRRPKHNDDTPLLELGEMPPSHRTSLEQPFVSPRMSNSNASLQDIVTHHTSGPVQDSPSRKAFAIKGISPSLSHQDQRPFKLLFTGGNTWILEVSAIFLSISGFAALMVLLLVFENKPVTHWTFPISFNAVISILGATSRAALAFAISACISQKKWNWYRTRSDDVMVFDRFEEASRGPWGSLRLLWWTRLRYYIIKSLAGVTVVSGLSDNTNYRNWTALGALSAVVLVGFEPFLQAIVTFSGEEIDNMDSSTPASIGRTQRLDVGLHTYGYSTGAVNDGFDGVTLQGIRSEYDFGALAAVWEGFSNLTSVDNLKPDFSCPTGNCTWEAYASLAVCSACNDISGQISQSTGRAALNDSVITTFVVPTLTAFENNKTKKFPYTRYEIPDIDLSISNYHGLARSSVYGKKTTPQTPDEYGRDSVFMIGVELTARATCNPGHTISFGNSKTLLISVAVLEAGEEYRQKQQRWEQSKVTAKECALFYCTNTYQSTVQQGVLEEVVLRSDANRNFDSFTTDDMTFMDGFKAYNEHTNYSLYSGERDSLRTDLQLTIPKEQYSSATGVNVTDDQRFNVSYNAAGSIGRWFFAEFSQYRYPREGQMLKYPTFGDDAPVIRSLAASGNITRTFENVAASLTKWMRNRSFQDEPLAGRTRAWVVRIRVNWAFLSLPVGTLIGGCVFFLISILETRGLGLPAWRGSSLATLAHGLDNESRALLREATSDGESEISNRARGLNVRFLDSNGGPELLHVSTNDPTQMRSVARDFVR